MFDTFLAKTKKQILICKKCLTKTIANVLRKKTEITHKANHKIK